MVPLQRRILFHDCPTVEDFESTHQGMKKIYRTLLLSPRVPQLFPRDILEYSFISGGEDEEASDQGDDNDEAFI
ncbi:hypothetical protein HAX54_049966 [Datura stramonium]|uniref:Uncharacterized protein n=1 Tax=Datura stramonium TaxID=4076 RepID=A0ABS8SVP1_DATST|nr:hypothetical protein [Datura stramonium]